MERSKLYLDQQFNDKNNLSVHARKRQKRDLVLFLLCENMKTDCHLACEAGSTRLSTVFLQKPSDICLHKIKSKRVKYSNQMISSIDIKLKDMKVQLPYIMNNNA